jgi:type IV secretion system protein VirB1
MSYDVPAIIALAKACAPEIATEAIVPLVLTESGGEPLQINVNKGPRVRARTVPEGAALVRRYIAAATRSTSASPRSTQQISPVSA